MNSKRIDKIYRAMEAEHSLFPEKTLMLNDTWAMSSTKIPGWWNNLRPFRCGPLKIVVEVEGNLKHKIPGSKVLEIRDWLLQRQELPNLYICGSQSPISPKLPYEVSDIDLVFFVPLADLFERANYWDKIVKKVQLELAPICQDRFGIEISVGILADEFKSFPAMFDAVEITGENAINLWDFSEEQVLELLEKKWVNFKENLENGRCNEEIIKILKENMTGEILHVFAEARWADVTIMTKNVNRIRYHKIGVEEVELS